MSWKNGRVWRGQTPQVWCAICKAEYLLLSNAFHILGKLGNRELEHWTAKEKEDPSTFPWITDSVLPIVEAQRVELVKSDHALNDLIQLIPTPGHTIDHYSVRVGKPGSDALITGDMVHSPIQARYPELGMAADHDSTIAGQTRRRIFGQFCDTSTLICTAHFPSPSTGRLARWDDGFKLVPA